MKRIPKRYIWLIAGILIGLAISLPAYAKKPQQALVFHLTYGPPYTPRPEIKKEDPPKPVVSHESSGRHSTRSQVSMDKLRLYLTLRSSPLSDYAEQIASSSYAGTIIGICTIEQYGCTKAPHWNYWGIKETGQCGKSARGFAQYCTAEEGIESISSLLARYEARGKDTIEDLNGYYVQPASQNWLNTVLKIKAQLENL